LFRVSFIACVFPRRNHCGSRLVQASEGINIYIISQEIVRDQRGFPWREMRWHFWWVQLTANKGSAACGCLRVKLLYAYEVSFRLEKMVRNISYVTTVQIGFCCLIFFWNWFCAVNQEANNNPAAHWMIADTSKREKQILRTPTNSLVSFVRTRQGWGDR
jgi:hypothetical protein